MSHLKQGGYSVEYAKSGRSSCTGCGKLIANQSLRVGHATPSSFHDGCDTKWYHFKCIHITPSTKFADIKGSEMLRWADQLNIREKTKEPVGKDLAWKNAEENNKKLWELKDQISSIPNKILASLLEANGIEVHKMQADRLIHKAADGLLFGKIGPCPECSNHSVVNAGFEYECHGWASEFTRCDWKGKDIQRFKWNLPDEVKDKHKFLKSWSFPKDHPKDGLKGGASKKEAGNDGKGKGKEEEEEDGAADQMNVEIDETAEEDEVPVGKELYGMNVVFAGTKKDLGKSRDELIEYVRNHGGEVYETFCEEAHFMVAPQAEIDKKKKTKLVTEALKKIPIFSREYLENLAERKEEGIALRKPDSAKKYLLDGATLKDGHKICNKYFKAKADQKKAASSSSSSSFLSPAEGAVKRKRTREPKKGSEILKVDPAAPAGEVLVTYDEEIGYTPYSVMLNVADVHTGANKYYRMQIIKKGANYSFFIKWGRLGTDVGDKRVYPFKSEAKAIEAFANKFFDCTANKWDDRSQFKKKPGHYFMAQLDDGGDDDDDLLDEAGANTAKAILAKRIKLSESSSLSVVKPKCVLDPRVQDFVKLIFDTEMMKNALKAMEIDVKKMPLGKIKRQQLMEGYLVLSKIQDTLVEGKGKKNLMADLSNRFYMLIPHDFGVHSPPLIDNVESVKKKLAMLETLLNLEIASNLLKESEQTDDDPLEAHYKSLKTRIVPLDRDGHIYKMLEKYVMQTHDTSYFTNFGLKVLDIFEVERENERDRFKPWSNDQNKMLLWHGSRLTNWVGILSQGLRIAPPEAPTTGYRFGKGVYFADVVSKSASYCFTTKQAPQGVMILSEVALGKMNELKHDQYMEKPPAGFHSTKALGMTIPDPKENEKIEDITVPLGNLKKTGDHTSCSHNEYIVYDVSQVSIRYLLRVNVEHKR